MMQLSHAETVITQQGNYVVTQSNSTTYVTGPRSNSGVAVVAPVAVNPITGIGQVNGPNGSYQVIRQGNTTTVIQTSKSR